MNVYRIRRRVRLLYLFSTITLDWPYGPFIEF
jgi:hypothetical protein